MTPKMREGLLAAAAITAALLVATLLGDTFRLAGLGDLRAGAAAIAAAAALAAVFGAIVARVRDDRETSAGRASVAAALVAALVAFLLLRFPSPWVDLGPFGAGPFTAMALVVLPLAQLAAVLSVTRWTAR